MPITMKDEGRDILRDIFKDDRTQATQGVRGYSPAYSPGEASRNEEALQASYVITEEMTKGCARRL
jgi:hypothetical protein